MHTQLSKSERDMPHPPHELGGGNVHPKFSTFLTDCIRFIVPEDCFQAHTGQGWSGY